jgi:replicative DNA helicase
MAKALYYRGAAYRKTGKSAQAISDLTSAVWLKNGLSDADRAAAIEQRQAAYQEAGLGTATPIGTPPLDAPAAVATAARPSAALPAPAMPLAMPAAAPADSATSSWSATSEKSAAEASVPNLSTPSGGYASLSSPEAPALSALPQGDAASASPAPLANVGSAVSNAGSAVTGFFGGMFGGGNSATAVPSAAVATATAPSATKPATPGWDSGTSVITAPAKPDVKAATKKKTAAVDTARNTAAGKYRLQVGIVSSRDEAEQITARLRSEHAEAIGNAAPAIDEVAFGNGTFYRVQVGPYASATEPGQFCTALRPKGFDCLVVTK